MEDPHLTRAWVAVMFQKPSFSVQHLNERIWPRSALFGYYRDFPDFPTIPSGCTPQHGRFWSIGPGECALRVNFSWKLSEKWVEKTSTANLVGIRSMRWAERSVFRRLPGPHRGWVATFQTVSLLSTLSIREEERVGYDHRQSATER